MYQATNKTIRSLYIPVVRSIHNQYSCTVATFLTVVISTSWEIKVNINNIIIKVDQFKETEHRREIIVREESCLTKSDSSEYKLYFVPTGNYSP